MKHANRVLSNKCSRFLYDLKQGTPKENRHRFIFDSEKEYWEFLDSIEEKLVSLNRQNQDHIKEIRSFKKENKALTERIDLLSKQFLLDKEEQNKQLDSEKLKLISLENQFKDISAKFEQGKLETNNLIKKNEELENKSTKIYEDCDLLKRQNTILKYKLRNYNVIVVKVAAAIILSLSFLFFILHINIK